MNSSTVFAFCIVLIAGLVFTALPTVEAQFGYGGFGRGFGGFGRGMGFGRGLGMGYGGFGRPFGGMGRFYG